MALADADRLDQSPGTAYLKRAALISRSCPRFAALTFCAHSRRTFPWFDTQGFGRFLPSVKRHFSRCAGEKSRKCKLRRGKEIRNLAFATAQPFGHRARGSTEKLVGGRPPARLRAVGIRVVAMCAGWLVYSYRQLPLCEQIQASGSYCLIALQTWIYCELGETCRGMGDEPQLRAEQASARHDASRMPSRAWHALTAISAGRGNPANCDHR